MNFFGDFHPAVIFIYFMLVLLIQILIFDPVCFLLFFLSQVILYLYVKGRPQGVSFVLKCFGLIIVCAGVNTLINHRGQSVIGFLNGLPVTWESMIYGAMTGILLASSLLLFGAFQTMMGSERLMCLFAKRCPQFSLLFCLALRLVPKIKRDYQKLRENHSRRSRRMTTLVGLTLEDSMEMGIVMKNRGYASGKRTSVYARVMQPRDYFLMGTLILTATSGLVLYKLSGTQFLVFPYVDYVYGKQSVFAYSIWAVCMNLPMIINIWEECKWKAIVSKI